MKYVYKVTTHDGNSVFGYCFPKYSLKFKIGKKTIAKIGRIFVFKKLEHALCFRDITEDQRIFKCIYGGYAKKLNNRAYFSESAIEIFWRRYSSRNLSLDWYTPVGTFSVKSLTPIEEVKP